MTKGNSADLAIIARLATATSTADLEAGDPGCDVEPGSPQPPCNSTLANVPDLTIHRPTIPLKPVIQAVLPFDANGVEEGFNLLKSRCVLHGRH